MSSTTSSGLGTRSNRASGDVQAIHFPYSIPSARAVAQTAATCGPSCLFEMLMRDTTPMSTMRRTSAPRTMGRVSILLSLLRFLSTFVFPVSCAAKADALMKVKSL